MGKRYGFTLIEAATALFVFSVIAVTFYEILTLGALQILEAKHRLNALSVANEKMEIAHNLNYDALGTKKLNADGSYSYGIPAGDILEDETVTNGSGTFFVHSFVQFVDDAFDGKITDTSPLDTIPNDYKRLKVEVFWGNKTDVQKVELVATFIPNGVETAGGGGVLLVNVLNSAGGVVPSATVHITNTLLTPHIDVTTQTDAFGNLTLPSAKASSQGYKIEVSKNGYASVATYPPYPLSAFIPVDVHASVVEGMLNQKTMIMDKSVDISLTTQDIIGNTIPQKSMYIEGGRKIGDGGIDFKIPQYSLSSGITTDTNGTISLQGVSSGNYTIAASDDAQYQFLGVGDVTTGNSASFLTVGGEAKKVACVFLNKQLKSVLLTVFIRKSGSPDAIAPLASVHLVNVGINYDVTLPTDVFGRAYFPSSMTELPAGAYTYTVTLSGYTDTTGILTVSNGMVSEDVILVPSQ